MAAKVTLKTIAEYTGVSVPTVSQILNNRKSNYCSEATRQKVLNAAKKFHYRPNFGYQLMRGRKTNTFAMLTSSGNYYNEAKQRQLLLSVLRSFNQRGCTVYVHSLGNHAEQNCELVRNLIHRGVESVIIYGHPFGMNEIIDILIQSEVNFIGTEDICPRYAGNGSELGRVRILKYLTETTGGDFKFVHFGDINPDRKYLRALHRAFPELSFREAMEKYVYQTPQPEAVSSPNWVSNNTENMRLSWQCGYQAMENILKMPHVPQAVMFANDACAIGGGGCLLAPGNEKFRDKIIIAGYNNDIQLESFPLPIISGEDDIFRQAQILVERSMDNDPCMISVPPRLHFRKFCTGSSYPQWHDEVVHL